MTERLFTKYLNFFLLVIAPFGVMLFILALLYGCQQNKSEAPKPAALVTFDNLQVAYGKSVKYEHMYTLFAQRAEKERLKDVARMYRAIARSEGIHAANHASLMRSHNSEPKMPEIESLAVGTTLQSLKMALSSEEIEVESMYPNLIRTAELENLPEAIEQFNRTKDADARQVELLKDALDSGTKIAKVQYFVCTGCGYILTSEKTDECPTCHSKKEKFEKI
jgi:rubrerythrin